IKPNNALHGEQCGVGTIVMAYLHGANWKRIRETLKTVGAPTTAEELGVTADEVITALVSAWKIRPERYTVLRRGLEKKEAEKLARETGVI
ncbi:MAG: glycerol-1-phosphate dehydrogenase, partial [Candidatus Hadarchaeales archaeon]